MTELTYLFGAVALLAGALSSITIWAPRRLAIKVLALGGVTLFLPAAYAGFAQLLALPKPVALEWWQANAEEATVLAASMREDEAIYLWLQLKDVPEPRAYSLPWQRELAEQLQAAQREAAGEPVAGPDALAVRKLVGRARAEILRHAATPAAAKGPRPATGSGVRPPSPAEQLSGRPAAGAWRGRHRLVPGRLQAAGHARQRRRPRLVEGFGCVARRIASELPGRARGGSCAATPATATCRGFWVRGEGVIASSCPDACSGGGSCAARPATATCRAAAARNDASDPRPLG